MLKLAARLIAGASSVIGYVLAAIFTIYPANSIAQKEMDLRLCLIFGLCAFLLVVAVYILEQRHDSKRDRELKQFIWDAANRPQREEPPDALGQRAPASAPTPVPRRIDFAEYAEAAKASDESGANTYAAAVLQRTPVPKSLREELFHLAANLKMLLNKYHGSLAVDSFVSPEITSQVYMPIREARKSVRQFLPMFAFSKMSELPVTVVRMAKLSDDLKRAAAEMPADIPPN